MNLKILKTDIKLCLVEHILDEMIKRAQFGFLHIFGVQYVIGRALSFSITLKPRRFIYSIFPSINSSHILLSLQ